MRLIIVLCLSLLIAAVPAVAGSITAVTEEMPPFNYTEDGRITGFSTEIVKEVFRRADIQAEFRVYPWKRAYEIALKQPNTLIYSIGRNPDRENRFKWVGVIAPVNIYFCKLADRDDIVIETVADAGKYRIGAVRDDYTTQYLESQGLSDALDISNSYLLNVRKLLGGRVDLICVDELTLASHIRAEAAAGRKASMDGVEKALLLEDISTGMYMAFSLGTPDATVERCRTVLAEMKADGTYDRIMGRFRF